jgi:hypothetical protein
VQHSHESIRDKYLSNIPVVGTRLALFCRLPEHGRCHGMSRWIEVFCTIRLLCSGTRCNAVGLQLLIITPLPLVSQIVRVREWCVEDTMLNVHRMCFFFSTAFFLHMFGFVNTL